MDLHFSFIYKPKFLNLLVFFILLSTSYGLSQEIPKDTSETKEIFLDEVTVESGRRPSELKHVSVSVQILSQQRIQGAQATISLEESLRSIPGIFVNNRFNFAQGDRISIRGIGARSQFGVRGIKMILDGIPLTFPDGQTQISNIDIASLGKIEVLKGANSTLYGNSAGGIIYLKSENPSSDKITITPSFMLGTFGLQKTNFKLSGTLNKFSYLINSNRLKYEGYRDFSSSEFFNLNSIFKYQISNNSTLSFIVNGNNAPYLLNPGSLDKKTSDESPKTSRQFNQLQGAGKKIRQAQTGLTYSLKFKNNQIIDVTGYGILRDLYNPIPGRIIDLSRKTTGLRTTYNKGLVIHNSNLHFSTGYDIEYQTDKRNEFQNKGITEEVFVTLKPKEILNKVQKGPLLVDQDESIIGNGVFAKLDYSISKWIVSAGARFDHYQFEVKDHFLQDNSDNSGSTNLSQINPSFGISYQLNKTFKLYSNYSSAFQTPSANEFGNLPTGAGGFNKDLKPETIKNIEGGIKGNIWNERISYDLSIFNLEITNQLIPYQTANTSSEELFFRNAGKTHNVGIESFISFHPISFLYIDFSYARNNFRFVDYKVESENGIVQLKDKKVPGIPTDRFYASIRYIGKQGFTGELNYQYTGSYFANDFNGSPEGSDKDSYRNKAYNILDLRLSYEKKIGRLYPKIYGGINNILNEQYNGSIVPNAAGNRFFEPAPGTNWYIGISVPITLVR